MMELRQSPRINVIWRAAIKLADQQLVLAKVVNLSAEGILMLSPEFLPVQHDYQMLIEIPAIDHTHEHYKVNCKVTANQSILSGDTYRISARFREISPLHQELVNAWLSKTTWTQSAR